jgi:asparagine synthase (glutamine-hydrolysing)
MCGIVGGYGNCVDNAWVTNQTSRLAYRGPDFQADLKLSNQLHLGSARLAMTDPLPRSNQPFRTKKSALIYNGEIYNHNEIRTDLESLGEVFETESDTEVLIKSLDYWGSNSYEKFQGMFAFAYFNFEVEKLVLGRDFLGKKPLYYVIANDTLHWSSSAKSLRLLLSEDKLCSTSIFDYLALGYTIDPSTIDEEILAVLPGHFLEFKLTNGVLKEIKQVKTSFTPNLNSEKKKLREIVSAAVESRIEGHESIAISLSGGLDSAIIALVASQKDTHVTAYSASWPDSDKTRYNEDSRRARQISGNLGIDYCEVDIFQTKDLDKNLREYVIAMEEPNSNPSGLSMLNLYKNISENGHRLVLTGDGADEIFGGYPRYEALARFPNLFKLDSSIISKILDQERTSINNRFLQLLVSQSANKNFDNWLHWHWNFTPKELQRLAPSLLPLSESQKLRKRLSVMEPAIDANSISFNMQMDREIWLGMESNRKLDRISMHYSIEARSPFQDEQVIAFALNYMDSKNFKLLGKGILRDSFPELSDIGIRDDKAGFISPVGHWLRGNPVLVNRALKELSLKIPLDQNFLNELENSPRKGEFRKIMQLWSLVVLSYWVQENNDK